MSKNFQNSKIVVIGATGFVGSWLCLYFSKLKFNYIGFGLKENKNKFHKKIKSQINTKYLDVTNKKKLFFELNQFKPNLIINLAAHSLVHFCNTFPSVSIRNNTISTLNILEYIRENKKTYLLNFTSDKVYENKGYSHNENSNYGSNTIYGTTKILSDLLSSNYKTLYKLKILNIRCGNLYGGGDFNPNRFFNDLFSSHFNKKKLILRSPKSTRPWTYIHELINFLIIISEKFYEAKIMISYDGINFSSNYKNYSVEEILHKIKKFADIKWTTEKNFVKEDLHLKINSNYIRKKIKYKNQFNFDISLKDTLDWYKTYYSNGDIIKKSKDQMNKLFF